MPNYYSFDLKNKVVELYHKNYSVKELSKMFNISFKTIYNWINQFENNTIDKNKKKFVKPTSLFRNIHIRLHIKLYIHKHSDFQYKKLINHIFKKLNLSISKTTLFKIIKDLSFTKKIISLRKKYGLKSKITKHIKKLKQNLKNINPSDIISVDEVSFDTNIINNRGWSPKGNIIFKNIGATYKRITVICAICNSKILHYKIINNSSNAISFLDFIKELNPSSSQYILLDNARIHHAKIVKNYIDSKNINFIFNAPYNPWFNPIEYIFSKLKTNVKKYNNNHTLINLKHNISKAFKTITFFDLNHSFIHSISKLLSF